MSKILVAAVVFFATFAVVQAFRGRASPDEKKAARIMVREGALVVDVRTPDEFAAGHIEGARNMPVQEIKNRMGELGAKDRAIVLYCVSGGRAASAKSILLNAGFTNVLNAGGLKDLQGAD